MSTFLVIEPDSIHDHKKPGRGARGGNLVSFLKTYFGKSAVSWIKVSFLNRKCFFSVDHVFIGMPSSISKIDLKKISYGKLHLYDYGDHPRATWQNSDEQLLRSLTSSYLKAWTQENWDDGLDWATLPIRRHSSLSICVISEKIKRKFNHKERFRPNDTTFLGNPIVSWTENVSDKPNYIRLKWLGEIASQDVISFSGGFFMRDLESRKFKDRANPNLRKLFLERGRMNFRSYFKMMLESKTALVPPGNALWSYRHYEAIYAGCILVSADFRNAEMLVPLPIDGMIHLAKNDSVVSGVKNALVMQKDNPRLPSQNLNFLEKFLTNGSYDKRKKKLLSKFMSQLGV
jgi:hypothetical protein